MKPRMFALFTYGRHIPLLLVVLFLLSACSETPLQVKLQYEQVSGLTTDDGVFFESNRVGKVEQVSYQATGDYLVVIAISPNFINTATVHSQFFLGPDPTDAAKKAVLITQEQPGGTILDHGVVVEGAVKPKYLDELLSEINLKADKVQSELQVVVEELRKSFATTSQKIDVELQRSITDLSLKLETLKVEAEKLPERPEVQELQEKFQIFGEQFDQAQEDVRSYLRDTLLPRLKMEMDILRDRLETNGREEELEEIDKQLEEMSVV